MSLKKFILHGLGEVFDGLTVYVDDDDETKRVGHVLRIERIEYKSQLFQTFSQPVYGELYVSENNLLQYEEKDEEQLGDSPFGKFVYDGKVTKEGISLIWSVYENAVTFVVKNNDKTITSKNFFGDKLEVAKEFIVAASKPSYDMHDVVFDLKDI